MAEAITLECVDLQAMSAAFKKLEGTKEKNYDIDHDVAWNLAKNETLIDRELKTFSRLRAGIFRKHNITPGMQYGIDREKDFSDCMLEIEQLEEKKIEISGILFISRKELQKKQQIPPPVMSALMPILKE
jgi:hypothetical protein